MAETSDGSNGLLPVIICVGSSCYVRGSEQVAATFEQLVQARGLTDRVRISGAFCMEKCSMRVCVRLGDGEAHEVAPEQAAAFFAAEIEPRARGER